MRVATYPLTPLILASLLLLAGPVRGGEREAETQSLPYAIVDTGQERCYDAQREIRYPSRGQPFFGQDAHYAGHEPC